MKKIVAAALLAALAVSWGAAPASADSRSHLRWEGAALALGTLGVLAVISEAARAQPPAVWVAPAPPPYPPPAPGPGYAPSGLTRQPYAPGPGFWEEISVWVPGVWGLAWVWDDDGWHGDRHDRYRGGSHGGDYYGYRGDYYGRRDYGARHDAGERRGHYERRQGGGHYERQRVWREGR
jgi:hypothetical protein